MKKKVLLLAIAIIAPAAVYASKDTSQNISNTNDSVIVAPVQETNQVIQEQQVLAPETPIAQTETPPAPEPAQIVEPTPTEKPYYGEVENTPELYQVFDTQRAMNEANIAAEDQWYVNMMASNGMFGSWYYKVAESEHHIMRTPEKNYMLAGDDYDTNPVTQLKSLDIYAKTKYGSWKNAYGHWHVHRSF